MDTHATIEVMFEAVFFLGPCKGVIRTTEARIYIWKGPAFQRGLEPESRGIAIVRSRYQATTSEDTAAGKDLACALVNCEGWKLVMTF
jgi:hypothetical protein